MGTRAFWHLVFVGATGVPTYMTVHYYYELQTQIGLLLVLPIGVFLALQVTAILWLQRQENPTLAFIGRTFGTTMQYLALFEGLVLTVLVFYVLGGGDTSGDRAQFYADLVIGSLWLSMFIYGATGLAPIVSYRWFGRLMGTLYTFVAIVPPFWLTMFHEQAILAFAAQRPGILVLLALSYFVAMSIVGMLFIDLPVWRERDDSDAGDDRKA